MNNLTWNTKEYINWESNGCNKEDAGQVIAMFIDIYDNLPNEIEFFVNLEFLEITSHKITFYADADDANDLLPNTIINLKKLRSLCLYHLPMTLIPNFVYDLISLDSLYICQCNIIEISPKIKKLTNLTNFVFSNNQISTIPIELCELKLLTNIIGSGNNIDILDPLVIDFLTNKFFLKSDNLFGEL